METTEIREIIVIVYAIGALIAAILSLLTLACPKMKDATARYFLSSAMISIAFWPIVAVIGFSKAVEYIAMVDVEEDAEEKTKK